MRYKSLIMVMTGLIMAAGCSEKRQGVYASGTVEAREVLISAKVGGEVKSIHIKRSQKLKNGDPILDIDPEVYEYQFQEAEAAYEMAQQTYLKARHGLRSKEITQVQSQVNAAQAQYNLARDTLERQKSLLERGAISTQEVDVTQSQYKLAQSQLTAANMQYGLAREGVRKEDIAAADKAVERAQSGMKLAQLQLDYSRIKSPGELTVSEIYVEQGELAAPGSALTLLQDLTDFYIDVFVPIQRIALVHAEDPVDIKVEGFPGRKFKGYVERVNPRAEFTPENVSTEEGRSHLVFKVRVKVADPERILKPGLPADAWILPKQGA